MKTLTCPITGETILTIDSRGVRRRENYAEVFFHLKDGSRMRVAMSRNAKSSLNKGQADSLLASIKETFSGSIGKGSAKGTKKTAILSKISKMGYTKISDKRGDISLK